MIAEFEYTLEDAKRNTKNLLLYFSRKLLVPMILLVVMGVALLVLYFVGVSDEITLFCGCIVLLCAVFASVMFVAVYFMSAKNVEKAFAVYGADGKEKFLLEYNDGAYVFNNLSKGNVVRYASGDIVSVKQYKNLLIIKLASKETLVCPNEERIRAMFAQYLPANK